MKRFLLLLMLCIPVIAFAQSPDHYIYNIVSFRGRIDDVNVYKRSKVVDQKFAVKIDDGTKISNLYGPDGKEIIFNTPAAALMYFVSQGWEIYDNGSTVNGSFTQGTGANSTTSYWLIRKPCTKEEFEAAVEAGMKNKQQ